MTVYAELRSVYTSEKEFRAVRDLCQRENRTLAQCLKADCLRPGSPLSQPDAARLIERFVNHYNTVRLHSAIGYVTPADRLAGRHLDIFAERDRKLELARQNQKIKRQSLGKSIIASTS